jgi:hypothetical protein
VRTAVAVHLVSEVQKTSLILNRPYTSRAGWKTYLFFGVLTVGTFICIYYFWGGTPPPPSIPPPSSVPNPESLIDLSTRREENARFILSKANCFGESPVSGGEFFF